jgi:predicted MPP superfamily phosphohydrolase
MSIFRIFPLIPFIYALLRFVLPLKVGKRWKALIGVALLAVALQRVIGRYIFPGETPTAAIAVQGALLAALILLMLFVLLRDVLGIALWIWRRKYPSNLFSSVRTASWMCGAALLLSILGVWQGVRVPGVKTREIAIANLPDGLDGFKIAMLTDTHIGGIFSENWTRRVVERVNAIEPDLILITGDIVDGYGERRVADVMPLGGLKAVHGVYGAPGNHDNLSGPRSWAGLFSELGVQMLQNEHVVITHNGSPLVIAGVTDSRWGWRGEAPPDLAAALSGAPSDATVILMAHQPRDAREHAKAGVDLQLSGHTHGGQVIGIHYIVKAANNGFVSGLYRIGDMQLYVSNGTGLWTGFPVRLGFPSEITEIVLRHASSGL